MTALDDLDDALAAFAVHAGFPDRRRELASLLHAEGVSEDDVALVGRHCEATVTGGEAAAIRVLVALLTDGTRRAERLADLRRCDAARSRRSDPAFGDRPAAPGRPLPEEDPTDYATARRAIVAYCRVRSDRATHAQVAAELGVDVAEVPALVDAGRALRAPRLPEQQGKTAAPVATEKADRESDARRQAFREQMRKDARRLARPKSVVPPPAAIERASAEILRQARSERGVSLGAVLADPVARGAQRARKRLAAPNRAGVPLPSVPTIRAEEKEEE